MHLLSFVKEHRFAIVIGIILFILPFFWYQPGAMDLGGDGNRLYFYDPLSFIKNVSLYAIDSEGKGNAEQRHAYLIYVGFIALVKYFINSPYILISIFNGIKLSVGFLSIYFIVKEFIRGDSHKDKNILYVELSAIIAGIFYIVATGSEKLIFFWVKALHSHDQVFLNPLIFLLLLRFLLTQNKWWLLSFLFVSFIFSSNFALISAPPLFAFYPIAIVFLLLYVVLIRRKKILIKDVAIGILLFLGLQSFHLLPSIFTLFDNESLIHSIVFKESVSGGVNFFLAVHGEGKASISFLIPSPEVSLQWTSFITPLVIIFGYILRKKQKTILLTSVFFLLTFFLATANITDIGLEFYKRLFYIPGFSMFRHFFVQWAFIFIFFYALLFGLSLSVIFARVKSSYVKVISFIILLFFIIGFFSFLNGKLVDGIQWGSKGVKTAMIIDPRYERAIGFIRKLPDEGKILMLPLTDNFNQVLYGTNNAAYVGPSSISILTHKKSFAGYQLFDSHPYLISENILRLSREKNYYALNQIFSLFNIRYIFHNVDPKVYEEKFPLFPNSYMMTSLPKTQEEYKEFVKEFPVRLLYKNGPFNIFEFDKKVYRSEVYIPDSIYRDDMIKTISNQKVSYQSAFIDKDVCGKNRVVSDFCKAEYKPSHAEITVKKNNPVQYIIHIKQSESASPFLLVFQNSYHKDWKLSLEQNHPISEEKHVLVNKYANGWVITEDDRKGKTDYILTLNLETQRYFEYGLVLTGLSLFVFSGFVVKAIVKKS